MVSRSPSTRALRTISRPSALCETVRRRNATRRLPVEEDADDVRGERGDQREGQRHVDVQPHLQLRLEPQVAPDAGERRRLALEQGDDRLERLAPWAHRRDEA